MALFFHLCAFAYVTYLLPSPCATTSSYYKHTTKYFTMCKHIFTDTISTVLGGRNRIHTCIHAHSVWRLRRINEHDCAKRFRPFGAIKARTGKSKPATDRPTTSGISRLMVVAVIKRTDGPLSNCSKIGFCWIGNSIKFLVLTRN